MGIYDREYIRDESSGTGLFSGVSPVTKSIIVISVITFLAQNLFHLDIDPETGALGGSTFRWLAASPEYTFYHLRLHELLTASFVHIGIFSLVFDMWFFWFIGREMESLYGSRDFLVFYLASAVLTTLAGVSVAAANPALRGMPIFGSWGPILAVMTLFCLYYPKREILIFFILPVPMWLLLAFYILVPLLGRFNGSGSPGIDLGMVLAGAGFAYAYKHLDLRLSRLTSGRPFRPRVRFFSSVGRETGPGRSRGASPSRTSGSVGGSGRSPSVSVLPEEQLDARLDEILAKIARDGNRDGLTEEEQRVLQEASRRARIRRSDRI
jgi:membrane associated rhomboid family serine protease